MKIDYEITVDVSKADIETKKRVQDAFFKLGIAWSSSGDIYKHFDAKAYTNKHMNEAVTEFLMFCRYTMKATHTIDKLLELAGMKTKTDLIPFDLEKALAGDSVVTRDGREVTQVTLFECKDKYPLYTVVDGEVYSFTKQGFNNANYESARGRDCLLFSDTTHS